MDAAMSSVIRHSRRNSHSTISAKRPPNRAAFTRVWRLLEMRSPWLKNTKNSAPSTRGSPEKSSSTSSMRSATSMVFAAESLRMAMAAAS